MPEPDRAMPSNEPTQGLSYEVPMAHAESEPVIVAVVHWPEDEELLRWFAESGTARLVLASGDEPVPWVDDPLHDWLRIPVHLGEAQARPVVHKDRRISSAQNRETQAGCVSKSKLDSATWRSRRLPLPFRLRS